MQWFIVFVALVILLVLTRTARTPSSGPAMDIALEDAFSPHLTAVAQQAEVRGYMRMPKNPKLLSGLERELSFLQSLPDEALFPASRHLCENGRFLQEEAADLLMAQKDILRLPHIASRQPRVCLFAQELIGHSTAAISRRQLEEAISAWQAATPLTLDELNALPSALKATLLSYLQDLAQECAQDQRCASAAKNVHTLLKHQRTRQSKRLFVRFASYPAFQERLLSMDEQNEWMNEFLSTQGQTAEQAVAREHLRQAEAALWVENAIHSLRLLNHLPWDKIIETASVLHDALSQDALYCAMDQESRASYRRCAAHIAKQAHQSETAVAAAILSLCQSAENGSIEAHCGYYLLDEGFSKLIAHLQSRTPAIRLWLLQHRHGCGLFRLFSWLSFGLLVWFGWRIRLSWGVLLPFALVLLHVLQQLFIHFARKQAPVCTLPRMQLDGLTPDEQTLVVCPVMLTSAQQALLAVKHLLTLYEANPDEHLHYLLLGDFQDSLTATLTSDADIISTASEAIRALCSSTQHPFFYLQRERAYAPGENLHHGRERKRGSLQTLLKLIEGRPVQDSFACATIDPAQLNGNYRYVITVDSDTMLPPGSALRMIGAMLHPLARRQKLRHDMRGVSVIQPRLETAAHTVTTPLGALLDTAGGTTPYNQLYAELDQNWFGQGTYMGVGIIDPQPFLDASERSIPVGTVLSHDLLEGELGGCAFAGDIVLYGSNPQTLKEQLCRLHRRIRGDWQLLPYVLPFFAAQHRPSHRSLDLTGRFKIWRNLLRSLIAPARLVLMGYAVFTGRIWLWFAAALLPEWNTETSLTLQNVKSCLCRISILPCTVYVQLDAIARALYRLLISHQHLLAWTPKAHFSSSKSSTLFFALNAGTAAFFGLSLLFPKGSVFCCILSVLLFLGFAFAVPFLEQEKQLFKRPTRYMREVLIRLAKETLTFFETAVTEQDHGLPPEHVQIDPNCGIDHHTSPASIGLYLCSLISAQKLGLLSLQELSDRLLPAVETIEALPKWKGLFYSWYDTRLLKPAESAYISASECGALAVCLLSCAQGIRTLLPELDEHQAMLAQRMDMLAQNMSLERLYDAQADLFWVGIDASNEQPTDAHYELLADESRLLSFAAIMLRRVPVQHWYRLSRRQTRSKALISYSGSLSEYLTPVLFQPLVEGTLLDTSSKAAVRVQRKHLLGGAFGISESAYYAFDTDLHYQHRAFGISELALNAQAQEDVLTPYASLLAMMVDLKNSFRSLLRLQILGLEGPLGLFEAADFHPQRTEGQKMRMIRSHMARHQGMILCAICNVLEKNYIASLFAGLPRAQAYRLLLEESIQTRRSLIRRPLKWAPSSHVFPAHLMQRSGCALRFPIDAHLLHGGGTSWLIDAQGGGFLKHDDLMLTHFEEHCHLPSGIRVYLRDSQSGAYWTTADPYLTTAVKFETAQVVFTHTRFDIACEMRMWVHPLDGSAIHMLTLENKAGVERLMEVCSYLEPSFALQNEGQTHPCFHNFFVQTERFHPAGVAAILRSEENGQPLYRLWHLAGASVEWSMLRLQSDKNAFLGRGRTFHAPRALEFPISAVADSLGDVVEPCMSIRGQFLLHANEKAHFYFVTHLAEEDENASAFCQRYSQIENLLRTYDTALTRAGVTTRFIGVDSDEQTAISRLTGALCYTGQPFQGGCAPHIVQELQKHGISPEYPILLLDCRAFLNHSLLKLLLKAHALYHLNGWKVNLIIAVNTAPSSMREQIEIEIQNSHSCDRLKLPGGIVIVEEADENLLALLYASARLVLKGAHTLEDQLNRLVQSAKARPVYAARPSTQWKPQLPSLPPTLFDNGYGGFTQPEGNYQITLAPGVQTPAPWCNPVCSPNFGTLMSESGLLFSYLQKGRSHCITHWLNDAVCMRGEEVFYLRDPENHLLWSLTRQPLGHGMPVRITHAPGETFYEASCYGIYTGLRCFTDLQETAGLRLIHLKNDDQVPRRLTFLHTCIFAPDPLSSLTTELHCEPECVYGACAKISGYAGLCALDPPASRTCTMSSGAFQGLWHNAPFALTTLEHPEGNRGNTALILFDIHLEPGESCTITTALLYAHSKSAFQKSMQILREQGVSRRLHILRQEWEKRLGQLQFDLPDQALTLMLGRWLPYQVWTSRLWMRVAFCKPGEETGCRDQLQDMLALLFTHPQKVREYLLRCSDDTLFLPFVTAAYVEVTADHDILAQESPYPAAETFKEDERVSSIEEEISATSETLLQHCLRIIEAIPYGVHDLPLVENGGGNDERNLAGESTWLGMFLCETLRRFAPLCPEKEKASLLHRRKQLLAALDRHGWDGAWYLRGWYDNGKKLGSSTSAECRIDLISQVWAVMCGISRDRCVIAMENAWRMLYDRDTGTCKLFTPPFDGKETPGSIAGYLPGIRENGGQSTRAACWAMMALHQLGQNERAWNLAQRLLPVSHTATRQLTTRYRSEPYVMAAYVYTNPQQRGRGGCPWETSSAAWYLNTMIQQLLGLRKKGALLRFCPVVPESWDTLRVTYRYGSATYHLHASRETLVPSADGEPLPDGTLHLQDDGRIHEAFFPIR